MRCGGGGDGGGEVGHRGSRFTVCSHEAAAEQGEQQEGVEKEKR